MDAADFLQTAGSVVYNIEVHSEDLVEHNDGRLNLFDIGNDVDDYLNNAKVFSSATEDESMAAEALRQLGTSTVFPRIETKTPQDLPLLPCPTCHLEFKTTADLNNHLSICKHSRFKCYACDKVFEKMRDLNVHVLSHVKEEEYFCRLCSTQFHDKTQLSSHMLAHGNIESVNRCPVCGNLFNRLSSLSNHMKVHTYQAGRAILNITPNTLETNKNSNKLPSLSSLIWSMRHDKGKHNFNLNFSDKYETDNKNNLNIIMAESASLVDQDTIIVKEEVDSNSFVVTLKETSTNTIEKKPYACIYCNKCFTREKALICHLKLHTDLLENCCYQCDNCEENFTSESSLYKHQVFCKMQAQSLASNDQMMSVIKTKVNKHTCEECGKSFSTRQKLGRHSWIHRKKVHACEICLSTFDKQEELDSHRLSTHYKSSPYVCTECGKNFSSRQGLWEHNRIHGDESSLYKCVECLKTFSSRQGYLIHKRKHTDERPYGCRFCWKTFRDGGTLRKHERIHTGERPHVCPLCGKAFNQKVVLREHVRWLHIANKQPDEDGLLNCSLCDMKIADKEVLCVHIVKHSDKMALLAKKDSSKNAKEKFESVDVMEADVVQCDLCGDKFFNKISLSEHVKIHI